MVKSLTGGVATVSVYAGSTVIAEYDNGALPASPTREYVYNPAGGATTGLLAMLSGGATTYYHADHLSVRLTTDASGTVLSQEGHLPFGEAWYQSGAGNKWQFTSYPRDTESGLDYALARYYNSRTGTFCSADPLAGSPEDPQSWNRYPYGRNNPIMITDPSGQSWWSNLLIVGLGVAAAVLPEVAPAIFGNATMVEGGFYVHQAGIPFTMANGVSGLAMQTTLVTWKGVFVYGMTGAAASAGISSASNSSHTPTTPTQGNCNLVTPQSVTSQAIHYNVAADAYGYFQPSFARQVANGIASLNARGIVPTISSGFRTPASQLAMRMGGSGTNPAAVVSWHQQGLATDFGTNANNPYNSQIQSAMQHQGMTWGGTWRGKQNDPVHYQQPRSGMRSPGQVTPNCPISKGGRF